MANFAYVPQELANAKHTFALYDDFTWYVSAHNWTSTVGDGGSIVVAHGGAGAVGAIALTNDTAADNDEIYVASTTALYTIAAGRNLYAECKLKFTEANTDDANVAFGFASSVGANLLVDDGAGMRATGTVLAIYKVDGGTKWKCESRNNATVSTNTSGTTAGGAYQTLGIEVVELTTLTATVTFKCDGLILRDGTTGQPIRHQILFASADAMQVFVGQKNGSANNELTTVDYIGVIQAK